MKKCFSLSILLTFFILTAIGSGCATASVDKQNSSRRQSIEERISRAEAEKSRLLNKLDNSDSIDENVELKAALAEVQKELDELKAGKKASPVDVETTDEEDGFKNTKERTIIYGPLGAVLHFTEWVLVKLYIMN